MKLKGLLAFCSVAFILIMAFQAEAQELSHIPAAFVDIGYGARPMGMDGAFVALADNANAVLWNPAGLTRLTHIEVTFMYAKQMGLVSYYYSALAGRLWKNHAHGEALIYSGDQFLSEITALLSYAYSCQDLLIPPWNNFRFGINLKVRLASFGKDPAGGPQRQTGDALGYGLDLGAQWEIPGYLHTGILLRDAYSSLKWNNTYRNVSYYENVPQAWPFALPPTSPWQWT